MGNVQSFVERAIDPEEHAAPISGYVAAVKLAVGLCHQDGA